VSRQALDAVKQQIPLLDYLQTQDWKPARRISRGRLIGLCPLHSDRQPSFLVDPAKNLFYCYGCGRGGDVIRFVELAQNLSFSNAVAMLWRWRGSGSVLEDVSRFYQIQLHCHTPALRYLQQRGIEPSGNNRTSAHRLRARPLLPPPLDDPVGALTPALTTSGFVDQRRRGHLCAAHRVSSRRELIWA
jgi:DNA primase